jgi:hypothetical protein
VSEPTLVACFARAPVHDSTTEPALDILSNYRHHNLIS